MLYCVSTLMSSNGGGSHVALVVDSLAEIYGFFLWVVVVGELSWYADDTDIINAIFTQHSLGNLTTRHWQWCLRMFSESLFQSMAYPP